MTTYGKPVSSLRYKAYLKVGVDNVRQASPECHDARDEDVSPSIPAEVAYTRGHWVYHVQGVTEGMSNPIVVVSEIESDRCLCECS